MPPARRDAGPRQARDRLAPLGRGHIVAIPAAPRPSFRNQPLTDISVARRLLRAVGTVTARRTVPLRGWRFRPANLVKVHCISVA